MPKKKTRRALRNEPVQSNNRTMPVKPWVRWVAIAIVAMLGLSLLASMAGTPAHAESVCVVDTDGDGIPNSKDTDIDGDGIVNGLDSDIDGDGIDNAHDGDPAATNCNDTAAPPIIGKVVDASESAPWQAVSLVVIPAAVIAGAAAAVLVVRRKRGVSK